ncbi:unnamed protein product [Acanthoscelides obtectus]|nr:unnamed protein product [Acanthoscelides obtectus]CAK1672167.1 Caspase-8 [Acanthoscelides obtectus]
MLTPEEPTGNLFSKYFGDDPIDKKKNRKERRVSTSVDNQRQRKTSSQTVRVYRGPGDPESLETNVFEPAHAENNKFHIDPENPGVVLIINQEYFYTETMKQYKKLLPDKSDQLEQRVGTEKDRMRLINTFKKFRFKLIVEDNIKHVDMIRVIRKTVASVRKESSLFICILSHGDKGFVYGANSCKVSVDDIQDMMCKAHLVSKPKVLILQSCQGLQCINVSCQNDDRDQAETVATDGPIKLPYTANLLTFWATVPGYAAIRNKEKGSWFIQSLCEKMESCQDRLHFLDICTRTSRDVSDKRWNKGPDEYRMCSEIRHTFLQDFFLPKMTL